MKRNATSGGRGRRGSLWALAAAALLAACGSGRATEPTTPIDQSGATTLTGETRQFRSFSDMDPVWSLASTSEHLWVATPGGLLRYPHSGGEPLRVSGEAGPGGDRVVSVLADGAGGVWALSEGGLARYHHGAWSHSAGTVPDVGAVTAMAAGLDDSLVVGGTEGLAVYEGGRWGALSRTAHVTALTLQHGVGGGVWAATRGEGVWLLEPDGTVAEHRRDRGMPCDDVRAFATGRGGLWAICDRDEGAVLARFDGTRWEGFTAPVPGGLADLGSCGEGRVVLLTELGLFRLSQRHSDEELAPGEVLLASVEEAAPARPRRYAASPAEAPGAEGQLGAEGRPAPRPFVPMPPPTEEEEEDEEAPPPRPVLRRLDVPVQEGGRVVQCDERGIWVGTEGLGVVRVSGRGRAHVYRTLDLLASERPFTVAADAQGRAWLLTRDDRAGVLGESGFTSETIEPDPTAGVQLMAFGARGLGAYALGQVRGSAAVRIYRLGDDGWSQLLSRRISLSDVPTPTEEDATEEPVSAEGAPERAFEVTFFRVDPGGRFWLGLSERVADRTEPITRGVAVIDRDVEEVTYHGQSPRGPGAVRVPDEVAAVAFTRAGDAWLGGLSGAVMLRLDGEVQRYGESNGLLGDIVNDIAVDREDIPWVATPAGVGRFLRGSWRFFLDALPRGARVSTLAIDSRGEVWGGGPRGGVHYDGERWESLGVEYGLVSQDIRSVHVDGSDRVWFVTNDGLSLLERHE